MGLASLQVCMDSSDWLQGAIHEENNGMDSSSSPSGADHMLICTGPQAIMDQRRLRPPHDQALNCPRCDSTHTKFCYYNNYSLSQPRYFCKTCRRYWTKGGTLRNIPVGGGCRKNKKISPSKKSNVVDHPSVIINQNPGPSPPVDFRVSHQLNHLLGGQGLGRGNSLGGFSLLGGQETTPMAIDFMECSRNDLGMVSGSMVSGSTLGIEPNFNALCSPFGISLDEMENYHRLMLPYEGAGGLNGNNNYQNAMDVKPNTKLMSLDNWQEHQGCSDAGKDYSIGYHHLNGLGSWSGMMNNGF